MRRSAPQEKFQFINYLQKVHLIFLRKSFIIKIRTGRGIGAIQFFASGTTKKKTMSIVYKFVKDYIHEEVLVVAKIVIRRVNIPYQEYVIQKLGYRPVVGMTEIKWR